MIIEFRKDTIYATVGKIIDASSDCRSQRSPKGTRSRMSCTLYDQHRMYVSAHTATTKNWAKSMARDLHKIQSGFVETICNPHPS